MSNSSLVTYRKWSANKTPRKSKIDSVIIHCFVGQVTAKRGCDYFATHGVEASANYIVGADGSIGLSVDEAYRAWTSGGKDKNGNPIRVNGISGADFDHRAVTIEVASEAAHPYAVTDKAYKALIDLLVDICERNDIPELKWKGNKNLVGKTSEQNMAVHRWFANKACPGDYLYNKHSEIAAEVNKRLKTPAKPDKQESYKVQVDISTLNIRKGPGTNYTKTGEYTGKGIFTIIEESQGAGSSAGWGKLKSGAGWISLDFAKRVN